ncbi:putative thiosulfate sulfurtransferase, mitochondrial isoform X2 [Leguminivora glycinivorella]|uniref:putative thiosulfate sulfurtransferase, mitochondrial isoform X2 n=1 Tax=Leguminivora glycinivorella TaxID=1035111 RepID=UPI00200F71E9|nr:putative thiosulfate sulfurtransferase, mitochondrial isoform X2 [Leguminivora glycinivorella]
MSYFKNIWPRGLRSQNGYFSRLYSDKIEPPTLTADYKYVKKATTNSSVLIVDVREPDEVKEHGKIPNSINIPLGTVPAVLGEMSDKQFQQTFNRVKPSANTEIIFYCMIGKRSGKAQQEAISAGYKNTRNYQGSWNDWASNQQAG